LEQADQNGKAIILDASPGGFPLYKTLGSRRLKLEIPLEEFGGEGTHVHGKVFNPSEHRNWISDGRLVHMIRKPTVWFLDFRSSIVPPE
jgi:hypothetical protein